MKNFLLGMICSMQISGLLAQSVDRTAIFEVFDDGAIIEVSERGDTVILAGEFARADKHSVEHIIRLVNGKIDESFDVLLPQRTPYSYVGSADIAVNGNIILHQFEEGVLFIDQTGNLLNQTVDYHNPSWVNVSESYVEFVAHNSTNWDGLRLMRYDLDGSVIAEFQLGTSVNVFGFKRVSEERVLISGRNLMLGAESKTGLFLLDNDGNIDTSFDAGSGFGDYPTFHEILQDSEGNYYFTGYLSSFNGVDVQGIVKISSDGSLDQNFTAAPINNFSGHGVHAQLIQDKLYVVSYDYVGAQYVGKIARFNLDGTADLGFSISEVVSDSEISLNHTDDALYLSGVIKAYQSNPVPGNVLKFDLTGTLVDHNYPRVRKVGKVEDLILDSNNKLVVVGDFNYVKDSLVDGIVRLLPNGDIDHSFKSGHVSSYSTFKSVIESKSGGYIIGGHFLNFMTQGNYVSVFGLNEDGSIDGTYDFVHGDREVESIVQLNSGTAIAVGNFSSLNSILKTGLVGINRTGAVRNDINTDNIFGSQGDVHYHPKKAFILQDSSILIGGYHYNHVEGMYTLIDTLGNIAEGWSIHMNKPIEIFDVAELNDGTAVYVGGKLAGGHVSDPVALTRIDLATGQVIDDFSIFVEGDYAPHGRSIEHITGDTVLIGGHFSSINGVDVAQLAMVRANGKVIENFGLNFHASIRLDHIVMESGGEYAIVAGDFDYVDDHETFGIARIKIYNDPPVLEIANASHESLEDYPIEISAANATITDGDSPSSHLSVLAIPGDNYDYAQGLIYPSSNYFGELKIDLVAYDQKVYSDTVSWTVQVLPVNDAPIVNKQISEIEIIDELTVSLDHLDWSDVDNERKDIVVEITNDGVGFSYIDNTVLADSLFLGVLEVPVRITDGELWSEVFQLQIQKSVIASLAKQLKEFAIYPNPGEGEYRVSDMTHVDRIEVLNLHGKKISVDDYNLTNQPDGMYLFKVLFMDGSSKMIRVIKE